MHPRSSMKCTFAPNIIYLTLVWWPDLSDNIELQMSLETYNNHHFKAPKVFKLLISELYNF